MRLTLTLPGDERNGHVFFLNVEESSGATAIVGGEDVEVPWLRAGCSCGWKANTDRRFTIEENAHWLWLTHVDKEK